MMKIKQFFRKKHKALSLIEVSIALVIIGLLIFGALRGWKWVESAKLNNTVQQVLQIQTSLQSYQQVYHRQPDHNVFWKALLDYGGPKAENNSVLKSSIGATFNVMPNNIIVLSPLTAAQALHIKQTLDHKDDLTNGWIKITNNADVVQATVDLTTETKDYKIQINV